MPFRDGGRWLIEHIKRAKKILQETGIGEDRLSPVLGEDEFTGFRKSYPGYKSITRWEEGGIMIVAELKPFEEIKEMLKDYKKIMVLGCGTCVTVCMSGGERQVELLASSLKMARKLEGNEIVTGEKTILRQCDPEFIDQIKDEASQYDAILSMACGAGVQGLAEKLGGIPFCRP